MRTPGLSSQGSATQFVRNSTRLNQNTCAGVWPVLSWWRFQKSSHQPAGSCLGPSYSVGRPVSPLVTSDPT